eukprot:1584026-Rhodomonas_salina.2
MQPTPALGGPRSSKAVDFGEVQRDTPLYPSLQVSQPSACLGIPPPPRPLPVSSSSHPTICGAEEC